MLYSMLDTERTGSIVHAGQILEPEQAMEFGDRILTIFDEFKCQLSYDTKFGNLQIDPSKVSDASEYPQGSRSSCITLNQTDTDTVQTCYAAMSAAAEPEQLEVSGDLFVGTFGDSYWHVDIAEEHRLLVNLSRVPLKLLVAISWKETTAYNNVYSEDIAEHTTIEYGPGEGVLLDNACRPKLQVPHAGIATPGKVFLRAFGARKTDDS